jgi:HD-GYP domain-containing protein (c-di-GMP phosphodiesterase class II)
MVRALDTARGSLKTDSETRFQDASPFRFSQIFNTTPGPELDTHPDNVPVAEHYPGKGDFNTDSIYATMQDYMRGLRVGIKKGAVIEIEPALSTINKIVDLPEILAGINPMMLTFAKERDYYILQPIHTMIYALKIGLLLNYNRKELTELAIAALLQNVGMFLVPDEIVNKVGALTDDEIAIVKNHPETGRDLLLPFQSDFPAVVKAVYQHHERENGKGYPQGIRGDVISEYAKVIGICDSYEAMTHNRPHKKALLQFTSVRQLIEAKEKLFSPKIIKVFLDEMSLYPVGSYVKLNNGAIGRVIKTTRSQPVKPLVRIIYDGLGNRGASDEYTDLSKTSVLNIVDVIAEQDLPE